MYIPQGAWANSSLSGDCLAWENNTADFTKCTINRLWSWFDNPGELQSEQTQTTHQTTKHCRTRVVNSNAATAQAGSTPTQSMANMHMYKMQPPTFTGEHSTFKEWKDKFQAYMGLTDNTWPQLLERREVHNNHQRGRPSIHNRWSKQEESWSHGLPIPSRQHMLRSSSNNLQTTPVTEWFWDQSTSVR